MSLKCGIVGLPNVGKSTLFNALTKSGIAAENYPFCTIEPNVGIVAVPDPRLAGLAAVGKPRQVVPAAGQVCEHAGAGGRGRAGDTEAHRLVAVLEKVQAGLDRGQPARALDWSKEELAVVRPLFL